MSIEPQDIYQGRLIWLLDEQICYNVLHARYHGSTAISSPTSSLNTLLTRLESLGDEILADSPEALTLLGVDVRMVHGDGDEHADSESIVRTGLDTTNEPLPGFVAGLVWHNTAFAGRSRRGRSHIPGLSEKHTDSGRLTTDGEVHMTTVAMGFANYWQNPTANWYGCVFSPTIANDPTDTRDEAVIHTGYEWSDLVGTMRTRKIGVGA